jgi:hypothetical protein
MRFYYNKRLMLGGKLLILEYKNYLKCLSIYPINRLLKLLNFTTQKLNK